ncbi:MAG TPA: hypothetical protein PKD55_02380, partial [Bellilinea sp.]|nr:hypothetical protein [Bellilinea sp.]
MASDLIQLVEDLRAGKKIREETVLGNVIRSSDPDSSRIPVLDFAKKLGWTWEIQQYNFTLEDNAVQQIQKLREGKVSALSYGRESTFTDIHVWDQNKNPLEYGALEKIGLKVTNPYSLSVGKRL